jgi:hypothetical protein
LTERAPLTDKGGLGPGLVILGMHRSGTSALTGVLHILGANLGGELLPAVPNVNDKGYWENRDIYEFDDRLLNFFGTDWYDVFDLPEEWCAKSKKLGFNDELQNLIIDNFSGRELWAVKDPRLCRLLPLWLDIAKQQEIELKFLLALRHPFEVAQSLNKRDGFGASHASLLWLRYVLDSDYHSRGFPRAIITFDSLLAGWKEVIAEVEQKLNLGLCLTNNDLNLKADMFLDSRLRHNVSSGEDAKNPFIELANSAYQALRSGEETSLNQIRDEFNARIKEVEPWLIEANFLRRSIDQYRFQIEEMQNSRSWRWTAPLRALKERFQY